MSTANESEKSNAAELALHFGGGKCATSAGLVFGLVFGIAGLSNCDPGCQMKRGQIACHQNGDMRQPPHAGRHSG